MRSARASGWRRQAAIASALPARIPACGPAEQLVAGEADEVAAVAQRLARERLAGQLGGLEQRARADVEDERERGVVRDPRQLAHLDVAREAEHAVVGRVHAQDRARLGAERARVVGGARAIGRADLAQPRARALHDLGDAEAVADLDELAARDHDLAPARERCEREHERGRAVVDADRRLRAGQLAHERRDVILPRAAPARGEVELEVRIAGRDGLHALERGLRERRAAEVRVQDDARGVEHRAQRRLERRAHAPAELGCERRGGRVLAARAPLGERRARLAHAQRVGRIARRLAHEQVDGWQRAGHAPYRTAVARGGGRGANPRYTALRAGAATFDRVQGARPRQRHAGARILSVDDATRAAGDAAVWPSEPRARAPSARADRPRRRRRAARDPVRPSRAAARLRRAGRARRRRPARRRVARGGRARDHGGGRRPAAARGHRDRGRPLRDALAVRARRARRRGAHRERRARRRPRARRPALLARLLALDRPAC